MFMVVCVADKTFYQFNKLDDLSEDNNISNQQHKCSLSVVRILSVFLLFAYFIMTALFTYEMTR